jgi:hypothetical protein
MNSMESNPSLLFLRHVLVKGANITNYLLSTYYVQEVCWILYTFILILLIKNFYYTHFLDKETEAQKISS